MTHLVDYWAKLDFWGDHWLLLCCAESYHIETFCERLASSQLWQSWLWSFRTSLLFQEVIPFATWRREIRFCFHGLIAHPDDHIEHGGTQTRHEAFWIHGCVFPSTDPGNHALNSHWALKRVWLLLSLFFSLPLTPFLINWKITNSMRFSTQLSLEECTVSKPCRLLDFFSSPSAFSSYLGFYLYMLLFSLLIPLAVTAASQTDAGDRTLHILPWTPGQVPQQRTQFLWAAYIHCWSDILHKTCHCSDINIFFFPWMDNGLLSPLKGAYVCLCACACKSPRVELPVNVPKASLQAQESHCHVSTGQQLVSAVVARTHTFENVEISVSIDVFLTATLHVMSSSAAWKRDHFKLVFKL